MEFDRVTNCWREEVIIQNCDGIHARPSALVSQLANRFLSDIIIVKEYQRANAKDILDIMLLALGVGTKISVETYGDDSEEACRQISEILGREFNFRTRGETE